VSAQPEGSGDQVDDQTNCVFWWSAAFEEDILSFNMGFTSLKTSR